MTLVVAIHGILTGQTDASWPDKFDAWMANRDPSIKVLKKEYRAGPFPRWNNWVKDPALARGLVNEIVLFGGSEVRKWRGLPPSVDFPVVWFVAHSNGAVIALQAANMLIKRGYQIGGLILTGAAVEADIEKNGIFEKVTTCFEPSRKQQLGAAIAYSSVDDEVVAGDASAPDKWYWKLRDWAWGKCMFPYGCLGRTGWIHEGEPTDMILYGPPIFTRWYRGGHSCYFTPQQLTQTFEQFWRDILRRPTPAEFAASSGAHMNARLLPRNL